ncbi:MAG TPA: cytochrome c [Kofleriaceae bacterium]|nr:cytochrome c [Kofleriaceae bacterium]
MKTTLSMISLGLALSACGGKGGSTATTTPTGGGDADPLAAQVERGKTLYTDRCAGCHGAGGEGTDKGPPVVGPQAFPLDPRAGSERSVQFKTAADVFAWTTEHMPANDPGSLSQDEYLAIFAFDLTANGVKLEQPLDGAAAAAIVLHP